MTIEGWVIIGIGALMWWALVNRAQRIERVLTEIRDLLDVRSDSRVPYRRTRVVGQSEYLIL